MNDSLLWVLDPQPASCGWDVCERRNIFYGVLVLLVLVMQLSSEVLPIKNTKIRLKKLRSVSLSCGQWLNTVSGGKINHVEGKAALIHCGQ